MKLLPTPENPYCSPHQKLFRKPTSTNSVSSPSPFNNIPLQKPTLEAALCNAQTHIHTHTLSTVCCRQVLLPNRRLQTQWRGKKVCFGAHLVCIMWIIKVSQGNSNTFCLKNLKRASFYKTSRKIMVHIFVYQRMVQDIEMPGTGTDDNPMLVPSATVIPAHC